MDSPNRSDSLESWLAWLEHLHATEIDLGLERVADVAQRAALLQNLPVIVTVAGTNGKGSVVAMLTSIYRAAGYRTGCYTSPHLIDFNERICVDGVCADDRTIVTALDYVERHRSDTTLTYFEYTTLAAMRVFITAEVDIAILEVGLGGRLDAVNIWDTDCAVLTSIALDHESWLGNTREAVGAEKVAIARAGKPLIVAETEPPDSVTDAGHASGACYWQVNRDYHYEIRRGDWLLTMQHTDPELTTTVQQDTLSLPAPALAGLHQYGNAAAAVVAVSNLQAALPVEQAAMATGLRNASLAGRFNRRIDQDVEIIVDVAHNPSAAKALANALADVLAEYSGDLTQRRVAVHAVVAMMADKAVDAVIDQVVSQISSWHCGQLDMPRALPAAELGKQVTARSGKDVALYASVADAYIGAVQRAQVPVADIDKHIVLVFGSFFTVTEVVKQWA